MGPDCVEEDVVLKTNCIAVVPSTLAFEHVKIYVYACSYGCTCVCAVLRELDKMCVCGPVLDATEWSVSKPAEMSPASLWAEGHRAAELLSLRATPYESSLTWVMTWRSWPTFPHHRLHQSHLGKFVQRSESCRLSALDEVPQTRRQKRTVSADTSSFPLWFLLSNNTQTQLHRCSWQPWIDCIGL